MDCSISGEELMLLAAVLSVPLAKGLNVDELNMLGTLLQTIGQNLTLIAVQRYACENDEADT